MIKHMFLTEFEKKFPDYDTVAVETLSEARDQLRGRNFVAVATDCGFPSAPGVDREHGNINGLHLIKEIRKGDFGKQNQRTIIAFNSAEMDAHKAREAYSHGGTTNCFKKGAIYPTLRGKNASSYTVENCTGETVRWLGPELEKRKNSPAVEESSDSAGGGGFWAFLSRKPSTVQR